MTLASATQWQTRIYGDQFVSIMPAREVDVAAWQAEGEWYPSASSSTVPFLCFVRGRLWSRADFQRRFAELGYVLEDQHGHSRVRALRRLWQWVRKKEA